MTETQFPLENKITELFAGVPVRDLQTSIEWYQRLLGMAPSFFPNESEAVWSLAEHRWLYIIVEPERAGRSIHTIICNDLEALIDQISSRGIDFASEERPLEGVRKVMYFDPDGNEIGLGRVPSQ